MSVQHPSLVCQADDFTLTMTVGVDCILSFYILFATCVTT